MKIDMNDKHELKVLCSLFACTLADLEKAVDKAGKEVEDIRDYFLANPVSHREESEHDDVEINMHSEKEVHYVCSIFRDCIPFEVEKAVEKVGPSVKEVKKHLSRS
ncbi:MAG: DUF3606 domain-containing protein [Clostridiales bacterium]|nr:DUF3606 domain-containing protein [Clostridiales bacterium]